MSYGYSITPGIICQYLFNINLLCRQSILLSISIATPLIDSVAINVYDFY
jgi:hypothetical protein